MSNTGARYYTIVLLVLISLTFFLIGLNGVNKASDPAYNDTLNFLELALFIKDNGGVFNFLNLCLSGQYKAVIQHPLYPLLLSTFASREPIFFEQAKLLSLVIGLMVVIAFFYITKDLYGDTVASVASALLIFNTTFLTTSFHVACEALLILFILLSVYWIVKGLDKNIYWVWAGVAGGLAYMTKSSGLLLIPIVVIVTLLVFGAKVVRNRRLWLFFALFLIICSPLIVRNIVVYSDPLYEDGTNNSLWLDSWYSIYDAKYGVAVRFPEVTWEARYLPTMQSYLQTHSLSEIINRFTNGIRGEARLLFITPDSLLVPIGKQYFRLLMVLFFCVGLIVETDRRRTLCALMTMATFFIPFAWFNPVVPAIRFIAPLIPLVCIYSAMGVTGALEHFDKEVLAKFGIGSSVKWLPAVLMVLLVLILGYVTMTKHVNLPSASIALSEDRKELSAWIGKNVKHDDLIVTDSGSRYWAYLWLAGLKGKYAEWIDGSKPSLMGGITSINQLNALLKSIPVRNETYVIILVDAILSPSLLTNYFEYNEVDGIIETRHIDGWNLVYRHSKKPATFLIYQIDKQ